MTDVIFPWRQRPRSAKEMNKDLCGAAGDASTVVVSDSKQGTSQAHIYIHNNVEVKDCVGSSNTDVFGSDAAGADLLLVFLGEGCRCEEVHADLIVWAWRLRKSMRTVFVLPMLDAHRKKQRFRSVPNIGLPSLTLKLG
jgi:hypothetical protein